LLPALDYDKSQWIKEKLGLDFPNLPYLIDGKNKLTQSNAILWYIVRKHKLCEYRWGEVWASLMVKGLGFGWVAAGEHSDICCASQVARRRRRCCEWTCWRTRPWISV
uniref:GST N-terminal domain-containing protein n=1 Tax=Chrysemys picta bellii TaxID=8478 RepID=A0A8C3F0N6_CHRPI